MSSATNVPRADGTTYPRHPDDLYRTPRPFIEAVAPALRVQEGMTILDPAAGDGRWLEPFPHCRRLAMEIREEERRGLEVVADKVAIGNFLSPNVLKIRERIDLVVGNPPFSLAEEFVRQGMDLVRRTGGQLGVAFLLRAGFVHGQKRSALYKDYPLASVLHLTKRPSFMDGPTDASEYVMCIWAVTWSHPYWVGARLSW